MNQSRLRKVTLREVIGTFMQDQPSIWPQGVRVIDLTDEEGCDVAYTPIADLQRYLNERSDWHGIGRHG